MSEHDSSSPADDLGLLLEIEFVSRLRAAGFSDTSIIAIQRSYKAAELAVLEEFIKTTGDES